LYSQINNNNDDDHLEVDQTLDHDEANENDNIISKVLLDIPVTFICSHKYCFLCTNLSTSHASITISDVDVLDALLSETTPIYIPFGARICTRHLVNGKLPADQLAIIPRVNNLGTG
jgi:hypothetical protein